MTISIRNTIFAVLLCCAGGLTASGQLSDMTVESIDVIGKVENGPVNKFSKRHWALITLNIDGGARDKVSGQKIIALPQMNVVKPDAGDNVYDAYAGAWSGSYAKNITLYHPDFNNKKIAFADYLGDEHLSEGTAYRINLKLPSNQLIDANRAFNDMDFEAAKTLYQQITSGANINAEEKVIANHQLADIDSLISYHSQALMYETRAMTKDGKNRDRDLLRARICYNRIFKDSGLIKAGLKINELNNKLGIKNTDAKVDVNFKMKVSSAQERGNDLRAMGNDAVMYTDGKESKKAALIIVQVPLKDVTFKSDRNVGDILDKSGEKWIYVKTELQKNDPNPVLFTLSHPEYQDFDFRLTDLDGASLKPETVYNVEMDVPSLIMKMATTQLMYMDLDGASSLFRYNFADADEQQFAETCRALLESPAVSQIIKTLDADTRKCRSLEREYFSIITGATKFDNIESRNDKLAAVNRQLESIATKLEGYYRTIYDEGRKREIDLPYAYSLYQEYGDIRSGMKRIPLVIDFHEMSKVKNGVYSETALTTQPLVRVEFLDKDNKCVYVVEQQTVDGKVNFMVNTRASALFKTGNGKIRITTPKALNHNKLGKEYIPYDKAEIDIKDYKINDYTTKKLSVTLMKN